MLAKNFSFGYGGRQGAFGLKTINLEFQFHFWVHFNIEKSVRWDLRWFWEQWTFTQIKKKNLLDINIVIWWEELKPTTKAQTQEQNGQDDAGLIELIEERDPPINCKLCMASTETPTV